MNNYFETFATKICEFSMKQFVLPYLKAHGNVMSYRAQVVSKDTATKTMVVQRPFDDEVTLPYSYSASNLQAGDQCLVVSLGDSSNSIVVSDGMLNNTVVPEAPTAAGTYHLTCTVDSGGNPTYSWT